MHIFSKILKAKLNFFQRYKKFSFVIVASLIALALDLKGIDSPAHWLLLISGVIVTSLLVWDMLQSLRSGTYGVDLLAATAIGTALIMQEYWTAAIIMIMLTGGESLEDFAQERAKGELHDLLNRAPQLAHVYRNQQLVDVAVREVRVGDKIVVKPGEVVPVDCRITEGATSFDESNITGESMPQLKVVGAEVLSGSLNIEGAITAQALRSEKDSQYQSIIKLVREATGSPSPFVRLADRYSIPFTIIAFGIAAGAWILGGDSLRFLQVLVVATPCPLILAAPIGIISGMSNASRNGIIIKNGTTLEKLASVKTIGFDKTGTLTHGFPEVDKVVSFSPYNNIDVLGLAASVEQSSVHVLGSAIVKAAEKKRLKLKKSKQVQESVGHGLVATVDKQHVLVGRLGLLKEFNITMPKKFNPKKVNETAAFVAIDGELAGYITFTDTIRKESKVTIARLKAMGIKNFLMVTGDQPGAAQKIARAVGIKNYTASALPADKIRVIEAAVGPVAFVGDGVNDAPVLTSADVGIALGAKGSTAASESADVVVMLDDISKVADAFTIAKKSLSIARQSVLIGIILSIVLMFIFASGAFAPIYGAVVQEIVDVIVIFNALRAHIIKV